MKNLEDLKLIIEQHRTILENKYKIKEIAIFGSYARGEQNPDSDFDILVEFKEPVGMLFIHLADYLEKILETKVDLLTFDAIEPNRRKYIMKYLIYV